MSKKYQKNEKIPIREQEINSNEVRTNHEGFERLKELASQGKRPTQQWREANIAHSTYYDWLKAYPELKKELDKLLLNYRKKKIKEAALIGAPISEQQWHANILTDKEYNDIMIADEDFAKEVDRARKGALKLWARRNIADDIQNKGSVASSWRYLENTDEEMSKTKVEHTHTLPEEEKELIRKFEEDQKELLKKQNIEQAKKEGEI